MKDINILIVDDDDTMRALFTDIIETWGYRLRTTSNGQEAQKLLGQEHFDIAFIDVHMPIMNGVETVRMIKKISPKTKRVMMDSFPDIILENAISEGVFTCLHKPFNIDEVQNVIEDILGGKEDFKPG